VLFRSFFFFCIGAVDREVKQRTDEYLAMNPITSWIARSMESVEDVNSAFENRVAETAVDSQKLYDERHNASNPYQWWKHERRADSFLHRFVANSALKNSKASYCCSFQAHNYYREKAAQRQIQLLEEIEKEKLSGM